jgi:Zn finger protein HypA/HybF involved in hydrogenase expression
MNGDERSKRGSATQKAGPAVTLLILACVVMFIGIPLFTGKGFLPSVIDFVAPADAQQSTNQEQSDSVSAKLQKKYFAQLDTWVKLGGDVQKVQNEVVQTCGKLLLTYGTLAENAALLADTEELNFRADVCAKMTVNKVHPQTEFENAEIVSTICDGKQPFYTALCKHFGHR